MTQEEIDQLPRPVKPQRDLILCRKEARERKSGSIFLPDSAQVPDQVCRVLEVGDGLVLEKGVIRRPQVKRGDLVICTPNDGYPVTIDSKTFWFYEWSTEVIGIVLDESVSIFGKEHC